MPEAVRGAGVLHRHVGLVDVAGLVELARELDRPGSPAADQAGDDVLADDLGQEVPAETRLERRPSLARSMMPKSCKQQTKIEAPQRRRLSYGEGPVWSMAPDSITVPRPVHDSGVGGLGMPFGFGFGFGLGDAPELKFDADVMHIDEALFDRDACEASTPAMRRMRKGRRDGNGQGSAYMRSSFIF